MNNPAELLLNTLSDVWWPVSAQGSSFVCGPEGIDDSFCCIISKLFDNILELQADVNSKDYHGRVTMSPTSGYTVGI